MTDTARLSTLYTVRPGDTLHTLAQQFYGDATHWEIIYKANYRPEFPRVLPVGMRLKIPAVPGHALGAAEVLEEVTPTATYLPLSAPAQPASAPTQSVIETVTTTAKRLTPLLKDWRVWAGVAAAVGLLWYLNTGSKKRG